MGQELYELPEEWEWKELAAITEFKNGFAFKSKDFTPSGAPILRISNIQSGGISFERVAYFPEHLLDDKISKCYVEKNDVVIAMSGATTGKVAINNSGQRLLQNQRVGRLLIPDDTLRKYVYLFLSAKVSENLQKSLGAAQPNLSTAQIKEIIIPIPPLNEQKRIVAKLDALFTRIDTAMTHLQQTLELSKALFESASAHVFKNGDEWGSAKLSVLLDRGWITSHLDGNHGSNYPRKAEFVDEGVPYISANCLRNSEVIMSLSKFLTPQRASMLRKGIAMNNDVLFAHNATVGPVAILQTDCEKVVLSTSLTYYRCDPKFILPEYLAQYMKAAPFTSQYRAVMSQSTRNQVPITKQREFKFIVPPINEQIRIAAQLDELYKRTQALEVTTQEKINDLTALKSSLLDAAFKGQLLHDANEKIDACT